MDKLDADKDHERRGGDEEPTAMTGTAARGSRNPAHRSKHCYDPTGSACIVF